MPFDNRTLLILFGLILVVTSVVSWKTGRTYFRRWIYNDDEPGAFFASIISNAFLGTFMLFGALTRM